MAVAIHEAAPARGTVAARTIVIARWAVVAAEFAAFVAIAWGRTIWAAEAAAGAVTVAEARPFHIAFDEAAFQSTLEVAFEMPARGAIGTTTGTRTIGTTRWRHVLVNVFGEGHELFFVELAVMVLVELVEHLFRFGHFGRPVVMAITSVWPIVPIAVVAAFVAIIAVVPVFAFARPIMARTGIVTVTSLTVAIAHQRAHFFAGSVALVVAQFAIPVFIELFEKLCADFGPGAAFIFFGVVVAQIGSHCRRSQQAKGRDYQT
jgi:hypothetical protein